MKKFQVFLVQILIIKSILLPCIQCVVGGVFGVEAPYQVSIRYNDPYPNGEMGHAVLHTCNGAIIHEKYILTSANCVYSQVMQTNISRPVPPNLIYVVAGNLTRNTNDGIRRNVVSIIAHNKYNPQTHANDVALLQLDRPLPLFNSTTVQWIELQQTAANKINGSCFINIYNYSVGETEYPYTSVKNVISFDNWVCNSHQINYNNLSRNDDLCLQYALNGDYLCNTTTSMLKYSPERGTSLVCNNKLTGLLAEINPSNNVAYCLQSKRTTAYYVNVSAHVDWIYSEIGMNIPTPNEKLPSSVQPPWIVPPTTPATGQVHKDKQKSAAIKSNIQLILILVNSSILCFLLY